MICLQCGARGEYRDFSYEEHKYNLCYRCLEKLKLENCKNGLKENGDVNRCINEMILE